MATNLRPASIRPAFALLALVLVACEAPRTSPAGAAPALAPEIGPLEPELAQRLEALATALESDRVTLHIPGLALAIVQDDRLIFARGLGQADIAAERAATPETVFAIGSTTKAFTATLVGMLDEAGLLGFDDPIVEHLPWFTLPIQGEGPVCLRDLLAHRTGFARMDILWYGGKASADQVLRTALGAEPLAPFRQAFHYNNVMFLAAGEACAAATGTSWEALIRERILAPLGMGATSTSVRDARADPRLARGYQWNEDEQRFDEKPMRELGSIAPAGALNSNVLDLSRWVRFLLARGELEGRRLIDEAKLAETWKPHNQMAQGASYGLGWFLRRWNGAEVIEHGGNIDGFGAEIALLPGKRTGLVLLTNVTATPLQATIWPKVFAALYQDSEPAGAAESAPAGDLEPYLGTYLANFFQFKEAELEVVLQDGKLAVDVPGQTIYELGAPDEHGRRPFALVPDQIQVAFSEQDGRVVALTFYQGGFAFECFRQGYEPPAEAALEELEPYLGSYSDPLSGKTFTVLVSHNRLAVDYPEQMVYELFPPDDLERWVFRANAQFAVEFLDEVRGEPNGEGALVFYERGTERVCKRVGGAGPLPTLDELMAVRRAEEFEARLAKLGTCRLRGTMRLVSCGIAGTTTTVFDAGEHFREETDLAPFVTSFTSYDGKRALAASSLESEHELRGDNLDQARAGSPAVFFGDWRKRFDEARVLRTSPSDGRELVQVKLVKGCAPPFHVTLDRATGDLVRAEVGELVDGLGSLPKTVRFEDWREVEGLRLPMRVISEDEGSGRVVVEYAGLETGLDEDGLEPGQRR